MSLEKERLRVDYTREGVPASVQHFRPDIYREEGMFYCVLGAPPADNITARGATIEEAMLNWDIAYYKKIPNRSLPLKLLFTAVGFPANRSFLRR